MLAVPIAIVGAFIGLYLSGNSINIYSQIGIVMLIGLAAKNGILIVEFANQLRDAGLSFRDAVITASRQRLRPIVMTAFTTLMSSVPLILGTGPGSESRMVIGTVIFAGVALSAFLTLFVIPALYMLMAQEHNHRWRYVVWSHCKRNTLTTVTRPWVGNARGATVDTGKPSIFSEQNSGGW